MRSLAFALLLLIASPAAAAYIYTGGTPPAPPTEGQWVDVTLNMPPNERPSWLVGAWAQGPDGYDLITLGHEIVATADFSLSSARPDLYISLWSEITRHDVGAYFPGPLTIEVGPRETEGGQLGRVYRYNGGPETWVRITTIPEPATAGLLLAGMLAFGGINKGSKMRSEQQLNEMFEALIKNRLKVEDTFKFGQVMGKIEALCWALGNSTCGEMQREESFEDYMLDAFQKMEDREAEELGEE